ncbi:MAG: osmotically inducible protein C [Deltaproteobacteria bacterium]|nr:MAG: osmotically inducible protein C [Deltaproteobacteria bacterium]
MITAKLSEGYKVEITNGVLDWVSDEPAPVGGGAGPDPYEMLLSALASCKAMTVKMYAKRKGWPLESVEVRLSQSHVHADDCADCENNDDARINLIEGEIILNGSLDEEQRKRLIQVSNRCPVHKTLMMDTVIKVEGR